MKLTYRFDMRRGRDRCSDSLEHQTVLVEVERPQGWETPTRAMLRAVRLEAMLSEAVTDLQDQGWSVSRMTHPRCECDAPTVGASGNCGYCGGSDTTALRLR